MMLQEFSAPLSRLGMKFTEEVGVRDGCPRFTGVRSHDEIGYLTNRFSEMVTSCVNSRTR